jgi:hypothetical protein
MDFVKSWHEATIGLSDPVPLPSFWSNKVAIGISHRTASSKHHMQQFFLQAGYIGTDVSEELADSIP